MMDLVAGELDRVHEPIAGRFTRSPRSGGCWSAWFRPVHRSWARLVLVQVAPTPVPGPVVSVPATRLRAYLSLRLHFAGEPGVVA